MLQRKLIDFSSQVCLACCILYVAAKLWNLPEPTLGDALSALALSYKAGAIKGDGYVVSVDGISRAAHMPITEVQRSPRCPKGLAIAEVVASSTHFVVVQDGDLLWDPMGVSKTWTERKAIKTYRSYNRGS